MGNAARYLDHMAEQPDLGFGQEVPRDLPLSELREEAIGRLSNPNLSGSHLMIASTILRDARPLEVEEKLWAVARDASRPRNVRARFAEAIFRVDPDRWFELADDLPEEDARLAFEGYLELELTLLSCGVRTAEEFVNLLEDIPEEEQTNVAAMIERIRSATGPDPLEAYGTVMGEASLAAFWPVFAETIARTPSAEALAALDLALLASPLPAEAEDVRRARERVLAARPPARRAPSRGQAFFSSFSPYREMMGGLAVARSRAHVHFTWNFEDDGPLDVRYCGTFAPGSHEAIAKAMFLGDDGFEVPYDEARAFLAEVAKQGLQGDAARELAPFRDALRDAPPLPVVEPGEPLSEDELRAVFDLAPFRDWLPRQRPARDARYPLEKLAAALLDEERNATLARALARQLHWLRWHGEGELARRVAAHLPTGRAGKAQFRRFARMWAMRFMGG